MRQGGAEQNVDEPERASPLDITRDAKGFLAAVRAELHALVRALAQSDLATAPSLVRHVVDDAWDAARFEHAIAVFRAARGRLVFDVTARYADKTILERESATRYRVRQMLVDEAGENDWVIEGVVDMDGWSPKDPLVSIVRIGA